MAKFNEVQKKRRALLSEKKRKLHGDPNTGKLKNKHQPLSVSGKRQRKLLKKWRRVLSLSLSLLGFLIITNLKSSSLLLYILIVVWCVKEQKEAVAKGLVTMQDVEMIVADAEGNIHS